MDRHSKIFIAGHNGMVGSAITRLLVKKKFTNLILKSRRELNIFNQDEVKTFYSKYAPEYVFICAAKVGGIHANNQFPAEFIYENLLIEANVIHSAHCTDV